MYLVIPRRLEIERNTFCNICHENTALRLLFCISNVAYLYGAKYSRMDQVKFVDESP